MFSYPVDRLPERFGERGVHVVRRELHVLGGLSLQLAFFNKFFLDDAAPWWGLAAGAITSLVGSLPPPAWSARSVKVSRSVFQQGRLA